MAFVVDVSASMNNTIAAVKQNITAVTNSLPFGSQCAVLVYSDVCDSYTYKVITDFTGVEGTNEFSALVEKISLLGGGDSAEAQYTAFAASITDLKWPRNGGGNLIVHITDAAPHTKEAESNYQSKNRAAEQKQFEASFSFRSFGLTYDLTNIADHLRELNIRVVTLCVGGDNPTVYHPYLLMAVRTDFPGFFKVGNSTKQIADQILLIVSWINQASAGGAIEVTEGVAMIVPVDEEQRLKLLTAVTDDGVAGGCNVKILNQALQIADALSTCFSGLVRSDGAVKRFIKKECSPEEYDAKLRTSATDLQKTLGSLLTTTEGTGPECALTLLTLRDVVIKFVETKDIGVGDKDLKRLFLNMSSLVFGHPMSLPHSGGKFNFEDAWDLHVKSVKGSHFVNNQAFLDYYTAVAGDWKVESKDQMKEIDDIFREGANTGVLPCTDGSKLCDEVLSALARTPWLEAITWHSVCHHALAVPHAVPGTLACALRCVLNRCVDKVVKNGSSLKKNPLTALSSLDRTLVSQLVRTVQLLPKACAPLRTGLANYIKQVGGCDEAVVDVRVVLAVQSEGVGLTKVLCVLAQNYANQDVFVVDVTKKNLEEKKNAMDQVKIQRLTTALIGELFADHLSKEEKTWRDRHEDFLQLLGNPSIDLSDTTLLSSQRHEIELENGEVPAFEWPVKQCEANQNFLRSVGVTLSALSLVGWDCALNWDALTGVFIETTFMGDRSARARVQMDKVDEKDDKDAINITVHSTLQAVPLSKEMAEANCRHYLRLALRDKFKERLIELYLIRKVALVSSTALPVVVQTVINDQPEDMVEALNKIWSSDLISGVTIGMHNVPAVLQLLLDAKVTIKPAVFLTIVCGKCQLDDKPSLWGGGKLFSDLEVIKRYCEALVENKSVERVMEIVQKLLDSKPPGFSAAVPGTKRFNRCAARLAIQVRSLLGLGEFKGEWTLTAEMISQAKVLAKARNEQLNSFALLVQEHKTALFCMTVRGGIILWQLGQFERFLVNTPKVKRFLWPDSFIAVRREWHVRTFFKQYRHELPFVMCHEPDSVRDIQGWQIPQSEVEVVVKQFLQFPSVN